MLQKINARKKTVTLFVTADYQAVRCVFTPFVTVVTIKCIKTYRKRVLCSAGGGYIAMLGEYKAKIRLFL